MTSRSNELRKIEPSRELQRFALVLSFLVLSYAPVLIASYGFYDDYTVKVEYMRGETGQTMQKIEGGRPTYAILIKIFFSFVGRIADFRWLRLGAIVQTALLAWMLYRGLLRAGWGRYDAAFSGLIICTMPGFQVCTSWGVACVFPLAAIASSGALFFAEEGFADRSLSSKWVFGGAVGLLLLGLTIYQPAAMFFWVFAAMFLFKPDSSFAQGLRRYFWYNSIGIAGLILGFGVWKLGLAGSPHGYLMPNRSRLTIDLSGKVHWFLQGPLTDALNLARILPQRSIALAVAVFLAGGLILYFSGGIIERLMKFVIALSLVPIIYIPNLVIWENSGPYRTQSALTGLIVLYGLFALRGCAQTIRRSSAALVTTSLLGFFALTSGALAAYHVATYFALPQSTELRWVRAQLAQEDLSQVEGIYLIGCRWSDSIAPAVRYDEFGLPSCAQRWVPIPMVYLLLREMRPDRADISIQLAPAEGPLNPPSGALVLDMRRSKGHKS